MLTPGAWVLLLVGVALCAACPTDVQSKDNVFDPEGSNPAPGALEATFVLDGAVSHAGITITLRDGPELVEPATTDAEGKVAFTPLAKGVYNLEAASPGYATARLTVDIPLGETRVLEARTLEPLGGSLAALYGTVELEGAADHSGVLVRVKAAPFSTVSDSRGAFSLALPPGTYDLDLSRRDYHSAVLPGVEVIDQVTLPAPVVLSIRPTTITGVVMRLSCAARPEDAVPLPAEGATVTLEAGASGSPLSTTVDSAGTFTLSGLPGGTHSLRFTMPGHASLVLPAIEVHDGATATVSDSVAPLELVPLRGGVQGRVELASAIEHAGTVVSLAGTAFATVTDVAGAYLIRDVCAGTYDLLASPSRRGYVSLVRGGVVVLTEATTQVEPLTLALQTGGLILNSGQPYVAGSQVSYQLLADTSTTEMRIAEDADLFSNPARSDEGWSPYLLAGDFTLGTAEGTHTVRAQTRLSSGVPSAVHQAVVVLDLTPPEFAAIVVDGGSGFSSSPTGTLTLELAGTDLPGGGADAVAGVTWIQVHDVDLVACAGGAGACPPTATEWNAVPVERYRRFLTHLPLAPSVEGPREFWVRLGDGALNWSTMRMAQVTLDRLSPTGTGITLLGSAPGFARTNTVAVQLQASDVNPLQIRLANESTFAGAIWRPFVSELTWFLTSGDGSKEVWFEVRDSAGNLAPPLFGTIEVDTVAPSSTAFSVVQGAFVPAALVDLSIGQSGGDQVRIDEDGALGSWQAVPTGALPWTLAGGDETNTLLLQVRDVAGNQAPPRSLQVVLDTTPPAAPRVQVLEGSAVRLSNITLIVDATPGELHAYEMQVTHNGAPLGWVPFAIQRTISLSAGPNQLSVALRDRAGNLSSAVLVSVDYDTTGPLLAGAVTLDGGAVWTQSRSVSVQVPLSASEDPMQVSVRLANNAAGTGGAWGPFHADLPFLLDDLDGNRTVHVDLRDLAGNVTSTQASIQLDRVPPSITAFSVVGGGFVSSPVISLDIGQTGASEMRIDEAGVTGTWNTAASGVLPFTLGAAEGPRTLVLFLRDGAGNLAGPRQLSATLDTILPDAPWISSVEGLAVQTANVTLLVPAAAGDLDAYEMQITQKGASLGWVPYAYSSTLALTTGPNLVQVQVRDRAGNVSLMAPEAELTVTLDQTPPGVGAPSLDGGATWTNTRSVTLAILPGSEDPALLELRVSNAAGLPGAAWGPFSPSVPWTLNDRDGLSTVYTEVRDQAGNVTPGQSSITLDRAAPTIVSLSAPAIGSNLAIPVTVVARDLRSIGADLRGFVGLFSPFAFPEDLDCALPWNVQSGPVSMTPFDGSGCVDSLCSITSLAYVSVEGRYRVQVCLQDAAGNFTALPVEQSVIVDKTAPGATSRPAVSPSSRQVSISWGAAVDPDPWGGVDHYAYELDDDPAFGSIDRSGTVAGGLTSAVVTGLDNRMRYHVRVRGVDGAANAGPWSSVEEVVVGVATVQLPPTGDRLARQPTVFFEGDVVNVVVLSNVDGRNDALELWRCSLSAADCRDSLAWRSVTVPSGLISRKFVTPRVWAYVGAKRIWIASVEVASGPATRYLRLRSCLRGSDCLNPASWTAPLTLSSGTLGAEIAFSGAYQRMRIAYQVGGQIAVLACEGGENCVMSGLWIATGPIGPIAPDSRIGLLLGEGKNTVVYDQSTFFSRDVVARQCTAVCSSGTNWTAAAVVLHAGGRVHSVATTPGYHYLAYGLGPTANAAVGLARCGTLAGSCAAPSKWGGFGRATIPSTILGGAPWVRLGANRGGLHATWWNDGEAAVRYGACSSPDTTDCTLATGFRSSILRDLVRQENASAVAVLDANPVLVWLDDLTRPVIGVPRLLSPVSFLAAPGKGEIIGGWTPTGAVQGYQFLYDLSPGAPPWPNSVLLPDPSLDAIVFGVSPRVDYRVGLRSVGLDASISDDAPAYTVRPLAELTLAADVGPGSPVASDRFQNRVVIAHSTASGLGLEVNHCDDAPAGTCASAAAWTQVLPFTAPAPIEQIVTRLVSTHLWIAMRETSGRVELLHCDFATSACRVATDFKVIGKFTTGKDVGLAMHQFSKRIWVTSTHPTTEELMLRTCRITAGVSCDLATQWSAPVSLTPWVAGNYGQDLQVISNTHVAIVRPTPSGLHLLVCSLGVSPSWKACDGAGVPFVTETISSPSFGFQAGTARLSRGVKGNTVVTVSVDQKPTVYACSASMSTCRWASNNPWVSFAATPFPLAGASYGLGYSGEMRRLFIADSSGLYLSTCDRECERPERWRGTNFYANADIDLPVYPGRPFFYDPSAAPVGREFGAAIVITQGSASSLHLLWDGYAELE